MPLTSVFLRRVSADLLAVAVCDAAKPNLTPVNFGGLGTGSPGEPTTSRLSGTVIGNGKGEAAGGGRGSGICVNAFPWGGAPDTIAFVPAGPIGAGIITIPCRTDLEKIDATVAGSTVGDIENKVPARARHMREQSAATSST